MILLLFLASCLFVIAFVLGVLYYDLLRICDCYTDLRKLFDYVVKQRDKLLKDNKRYRERLEKWRKEVDNVHKRYAHLQQPSD